MLEGFVKYDISVGPISVTITSNGLSFSKTAVIRMDKCAYVTFHIDESGKRIAIQKSSADEESAVKFLESEKKSISVRWNNHDLLKTLSKMMNWDLSQNSYKAEGEYIPEENAIIFSLKEAKSSPAAKKN